MKHITALCWLGAVLMAAAACGDDDDNGGDKIGHCGDVQGYFHACGGDPLGSWETDGYCADPHDLGMAPWQSDCRHGDYYANVHLDYYASVNIDYDYASFHKSDTHYKGYVDADQQCLQDVGVHDCQELADLWFLYMSSSNVTCTANGDGCRCDFDYVDYGAPADYRYYFENGIIYLEDAFGTLYSYPYCVGSDHRMAWSLEHLGYYDTYTIFALK